jgi:glycosyltransferase involved in cell wall biosynthesis
MKDLRYAPHNISKIADFLAAGKPVITNTLGAVDYISDYRTGFLVETQEQMMDRLDLLLHNQDLLFKMSIYAREFAFGNLNYIIVAKKYLDLIK